MNTSQIVSAGLVSWVLSTVALAGDSELQRDWLLGKYDLNGDARITQTEITSKKRNIFKHMDHNSDGGVSFAEYETMDITKRQVLLKSRFNKLDFDQDGTLTESEYCNYMGLFDSIDSDGDGALTSSEMGVGKKVKANATRCLLWFCIRSEL